ncbi:MAG: hypothetical protein ABIP94_02910 [Planctomycetota bacterium]
MALANIDADDLGFGYLHVPIPNSSLLWNQEFSAMAISLNLCSASLLAGSQGIRFQIEEP